VAGPTPVLSVSPAKVPPQQQSQPQQPPNPSVVEEPVISTPEVPPSQTVPVVPSDVSSLAFQPSTKVNTKRELELPKPPTSWREARLREINESFRLDLAKRILKAHTNVHKEMNNTADLLNGTLNLAQSGMNGGKLLQDKLLRVEESLSSIPSILKL